MNPTMNTSPELQLPPLAPAAGSAEQPAVQAAPVANSVAPMPAPTTQVTPLPAAPDPTTVMPPAVSSTTQVAVPASANDQDLIEKEWVSKAKQIVEKTRDNPYQQSQQLTVFKSDYLQKRYNKSIKTGE